MQVWNLFNENCLCYEAWTLRDGAVQTKWPILSGQKLRLRKFFIMIGCQIWVFSHFTELWKSVRFSMGNARDAKV